jgi:NADPH2:quinone reductase
MVAAIRIHKNGGPEVLSYEDIDIGAPGPGQIKIKQHACGVNFIDTYFRTGLYPAPSLPFVNGSEGAGEVIAAGEGVTDWKVGDRAAYTIAHNGYAAERLIAADRAVKLPEKITYEQAAGMMLKGMTVRYLLRKTFVVEKGTRVLIHAAAGGVGQIACQWANHLGAEVIGTVGSKSKVDIAKSVGCHHVINYNEEDFAARVKEITGGKLCDVVYDGVGAATYPGSLDCIRPLGMWVSFGNASGPVKDFNLALLAQKGSLFATRPTLFSYIAKREDLVATANDLFDVVGKGVVKIPITQKYALKDAAQAQTDLEGRKTTGSVVLIP